MKINKYAFVTSLVFGIALFGNAKADTLPADPWADNPVTTGASNAQVVRVQQVGPVVYGSQPYQPTYEGGSSNIWNTKMPEFTGEMTTWGDGGKVNAPEVNIHNMISITQHLRRMGYNIPTEFENKIKNAPNAVRERIWKAMGDMASANDPLSRSAQFAKKTIENETGMTFDNVIGNSLDLLGSK